MFHIFLASTIEELQKKVFDVQCENFKITGAMNELKRKYDESNLTKLSSSFSEVQISELESNLREKGNAIIKL